MPMTLKEHLEKDCVPRSVSRHLTDKAERWKDTLQMVESTDSQAEQDAITVLMNPIMAFNDEYPVG